MSENINLRELERKAWRSVFEDGLYDIFLGLLLLHMGFVYYLSRIETTFLGRTSLNLGIYLVLYLGLWVGKHFITLPRIGRVKFGKRRKSRLRAVTVITFLVVLLTFSLTLAGIAFKNQPDGSMEWSLLAPILLGTWFVLFFGLAGYFLEYHRLYLVGVLYALPEIVMTYSNELLGINPGYLAWLLPASLILIIGAIHLARFVRDHPVPQIPNSGLNDEAG
jgi:hypothetical protein